MGKLIIPASVDTDLLNGKVSTAAPALTPEDRWKQAQAEFSRHETQAGVDEFVARHQDMVRADGDMAVTCEEARLGKKLHSNEIELRLKSLNRSIHIEPAMHDANILGVYVIGEWGLPNGEKRKFICRMDRGILPEYSVIDVNMVRRLIQTYPPVYKEVPEYKAEKRGWRSILAALIKNRIITVAQCDRVFGLPSKDSRNWHEQVML